MKIKVNKEKRTVVLDHGHGVKTTFKFSRLGWFLLRKGLHPKALRGLGLKFA